MLRNNLIDKGFKRLKTFHGKNVQMKQLKYIKKR